MTIMIETGEVRRKSPRLVKCSKRGRNSRQRRLGNALAICVLGAAAASCGDGSDDCDIEAQSRRLGGAGLQDCGIARGSSQSVVDRCAVNAYGRNETFRALYELDDGRLEATIHAAGDVYLKLRETDAGDVERADCGGGRVVREGTRSFVDCADQAPFEALCSDD
jgi:hypothetical protein